ncbi:MAG TPA: class I SAM-dependent methyltransferase [Rudaea sp.]
MDADLDRLRRAWGLLGEDDPLWAILSQPDKRGGGWHPEEFFASGESEIAGLDAWCALLGFPTQRRRALDFGCGVGRLSRALATRYTEVIGVDISASMIAHARRLNEGIGHLRFVENARHDLAFVESASVDFVYSMITLQHMPAPLQRAYIAEFLRVLAAGGLAVFQVAVAHTRDLRGWTHRLIPNRMLNPLRRRRYRSRAAFEMYVLPEADVQAVVAAAGKRVVHVEELDVAGAGFRGRRFYVV